MMVGAKIGVYLVHEPKAGDTVRFADNQHAPMATLTVKNVGPIREAEIEVKKHTVFIGPQGTGKSTLAKLIAIGGDKKIVQDYEVNEGILDNYTLRNYFGITSVINFSSENHTIIYVDSELKLSYKEDESSPILSSTTFHDFLDLVASSEADKKLLVRMLDNKKVFEDMLVNFVLEKKILSIVSTYVPSERNLLAVLNKAVWSLVHSSVDFPESITSFAKEFEQARNVRNKMAIKFLKIQFEHTDGIDRLLYADNQSITLSQSASGYQSIIPLLLVVEHQRQQSKRRFIIEEPELNLYPTAQKDLIYSLVGGLDPEKTYHDAEWVITTHSPYVLTSYNTLMLAYKVSQRSDELRAEVEKIIPARYWINPDDFAAYYVDNGTVRSIISETTGMIADNELDDVSNDFAGEQDQLLDLYRSVPSA